MSSILHSIVNHLRPLCLRLKDRETTGVYNISIPHLALFLCFYEGPFFVIEDSDENALTLYNDLLFFYSLFKKESPTEAAYLPMPSSPELVGKRVEAIFKMKMADVSSIITSKDACDSDFAISEIESRVLTLKKGMETGRDRLRQWLMLNGYREVSIVMERGEFSQRNWIFDIYSVTEDSPLRVELFGEEIDLIRIFDIETQRSVKEVNSIEIFPAMEFGDFGELSRTVQDIEPRFNVLSELLKIRNMDIFINSEIGFQNSKLLTHNSELITFSHLPFISDGIDSGELSIKGMGILPEERKGIEDISDKVSKVGKKLIALMSSSSQAERLKEILFEGGIVAPIIHSGVLANYEGNFCITTGRLSEGINLPELLILTDREIFAERPLYRPIRKSKVSRLLLSMDDLKPGDFVVHKDHGIGRFTGLQRQKTGDYEEDLIAIEYQNGRLYVPFHSIERLQKYSAVEGHIPSLNRLGGTTWQRTKQRVKSSVHKMAEKLLRLYAERRIARGFIFSADTALHHEFDDFFSYEETPDQIKAVEEIKGHMISEKPMDMLLCGDVGYGKTEVAMRAAFRAVYDGKQAAVLVPTTILAEQHHRTFKMRFSGFPVKMDYLSRFKDKGEIKECLRAVERGEVDIIIGTHILLGRDVKFHDLGLLIIDEEHRFGVAQKERLKELKKGVDVLTLTATPVPRTLHISLSGIRDLCTIETPPEERLAVKSAVTVFNDRTIKEAIVKEIKRGGQIFFVHNRIHDMDEMADYIKRLIPEARIAVAHGQMRVTELEKIMLNFLNRDVDILLCTAIIGSGLDIPTANTIIINRADKFGLSDLYQLRGRVGRGNMQAYAYFLIPGENIITDEAKKRLKAIQEMSYLGAGFRLALKDLEIRGAGNLLGPEQSGHIFRIGFDMYIEMLEKAVAELKGEAIKEEIEPQIKLKLSAFIPDDYIPDITIRLSLYRRISSVKTLEDAAKLRDEISDRFGSMPEEVGNLISIVRIKIVARHLFISKVYEIDGRHRFSFIIDSEEKFGVPEGFFDKILKNLFSIEKRGQRIRFFPDGFEFDTRGVKPAEAIKLVEGLLISLTRMHNLS